MKYICFIIAIFSFSEVLSQRYQLVITDAIPIYNNTCSNDSLLTIEESSWLITSLEDTDIKYDFTNKKVVFLSGNGGRLIVSKNRFFNNYSKPIETLPHYMGTLYIFNKCQKERLNGVDAAIVFGSKRLDKINSIVKYLRRKMY